jgi:hypothetical protein
MNYLLLALVIALAALMFIRLRLKFEYGPDKKIIFIGLGRSGPELNLANRQLLIKLSNLSLKSYDLQKRKQETTAKKKLDKAAQKKPAKRGRTRSWSDLSTKLPVIVKATGQFLVGLIRGASIEQLEGEIKAGFEQPDLTGLAFGYYQTALGIAPGITRRFNYYPDWTGASFSGSFRFAVALPLYTLIFSFTKLLIRLPLRELLKFTIGRKKGASDG